MAISPQEGPGKAYILAESWSHAWKHSELSPGTMHGLHCGESLPGKRMEICHKGTVNSAQRMEALLVPPTLIICMAHGELTLCLISSIVQVNGSGQRVIPGFFTRVFVMFTGPCTHTLSLIKQLLGTRVCQVWALCGWQLTKTLPPPWGSG